MIALFEPLIGDALMGRVHIHQHQSHAILRQDIDPVQLPQGITQRVFLPVL